MKLKSKLTISAVLLIVAAIAVCCVLIVSFAWDRALSDAVTAALSDMEQFCRTFSSSYYQDLTDEQIVQRSYIIHKFRSVTGSNEFTLFHDGEYLIDTPLTNAQGTLEVYIDAEVFAPSASEMTTARVDKHAFSVEECQQYVEALFDGQKTYSGDVFNTKGSVQQEILELQRQMASETDEDKKQQIQAHIDKLQMSLSMLPDGEGMVGNPRTVCS